MDSVKDYLEKRVFLFVFVFILFFRSKKYPLIKLFLASDALLMRCFYLVTKLLTTPNSSGRTNW